MCNDSKINEELKQLIISDKDITQYFLNALMGNFFIEKKKDNLNELSYNDYEIYNHLLMKKQEFRKIFIKPFKEDLNEDMINKTCNYYELILFNESKSVIYSLSRLLYMQDKYKDSMIGQQIDLTIKKWLEYIKNYDKKIEKQDIKDDETKNKVNARLLYDLIPSLMQQINVHENKKSYTNLCDYKVKKTKDFKNILLNTINNNLQDSRTYKCYSEMINDFIYKLVEKVNIDNFYKDKKDLIKEIQNKYNNKSEKRINNNLDNINDKDPYINELTKALNNYIETNGFNIQNKDDIAKWREKANIYINHLLNCQTKKEKFTVNYTLKLLVYNDYQLKTYNINDENNFFQATGKQLREMDNARGGLVTYNESDSQACKNKLKELKESLKNSHITQDKIKLKEEIKKCEQDLSKAEKKEKELKDEYNKVCEYLEQILKSMANEPKTSNYYKQLKKNKKAQETRKKEIERILKFSGWQIDIFDNGNYEIILNKKTKEKLKLTIENLTKQIAKYTKEEQDIFDFLINKYLHNTKIKEIKFTLREYEIRRDRVKPTNYLVSDINAIRLLFREIWTYYTTDNELYSFNEEHLFTKLNIKGEIATDINNLDNIGLDTKISLEPTETLQKILQYRDNYEYISTDMDILKLNNDNEYLAKRLIKYFNYLARVKKKSTYSISLNAIIEELQNYGLKNFNMLDRHKTYKTEIVDVIEKALNILEGKNRINKKFIEVLDRQPFINYDNDFRGKSQETSINEWGKQSIIVKIFNLDDNKLLDTKNKSKKNKNKTAKN